jgi:hypothetical protein
VGSEFSQASGSRFIEGTGRHLDAVSHPAVVRDRHPARLHPHGPKIPRVSPCIPSSDPSKRWTLKLRREPQKSSPITKRKVRSSLLENLNREIGVTHREGHFFPANCPEVVVKLLLLVCLAIALGALALAPHSQVLGFFGSLISILGILRIVLPELRKLVRECGADAAAIRGAFRNDARRD